MAVSDDKQRLLWRKVGSCVQVCRVLANAHQGELVSCQRRSRPPSALHQLHPKGSHRWKAALRDGLHGLCGSTVGANSLLRDLTRAQLNSTTATRAYSHACLFTREWESVTRRHRCPQNGVSASISALDWTADAQLADSYLIAAVVDIADRLLLRAPFDLRASVHQQSLTIIDLLHPQ